MCLFSLVGIGQDTTFIVSWGGLNNEEPISAHKISGGLLTVSNTGSYGSGSSDVYFTLVTEEASIDTSWTYGGVTEDIALSSVVSGGSFIILVYSNSFDDPSFKYHLLCYDSTFSLFNDIELEWDFDPERHPSVIETNVGFAVCGREGTDYKVETYTEAGGLIGRVEFSLRGYGQTTQLITGDSILIGSIDSVSNSIEVFTSRGDLNTGQIVFSPIDTVYEAEMGFFTEPDSVGDFYFVYNYRLDQSSSSDIQMVKLNAELDTIWTEAYIWPEDDYARTGFVNADYELTFIGTINSFGESGDFGLGRWDSAGSFVDLRTLGSSSLDEGFAVVQNDNDGYWLFGQTFGFQAALSDLLVYYTNSSGITSSNVFLKLQDDLVAVVGNAELYHDRLDSPIVYPNPFSDHISLKNISGSTAFRFTIFDAFGRIVKVDSEEYGMIDLSALNNGVYFYHLIHGSKSYRGKLIKK
jgi:hypothetical protein